jgi:hypothetical protein
MLGKSFPSVARVVVPPRKGRKLALPLLAAALLAGCGGGSAGGTSPSTKLMARDGFSTRVPVGWQLRVHDRTSEARKGAAVVSVSVFPLARPFTPALWPRAVPQLDRVARELARGEGATVASSETTTIGRSRGRVYVLDRRGAEERVGFVLAGRREYQLYCHAAGSACDRLFASFTIRRA